MHRWQAGQHVMFLEQLGEMDRGYAGWRIDVRARVTRTIINQRRSTGWVVDGHSQGQLAAKLTNRLEGENQSAGISNVVSIKEGSMHQSTT